MKVYFRTPELVSIDALTTLGVSVKESDNPIGFFGSGFKYALAWLLRNNHEIVIHRRAGGQALCPITFSLKSTSIRGKDFDLIQLHEEPNPPRVLGFTTDLGPTWLAWQAYRELHSNTLDEGGEIIPVHAWARSDETIIEVIGEDFFKAYLERDKIFLSGEPIWKSKELAVHDAPSNKLYYRGVAAYTPGTTVPLTLNILRPMSLTEDRTFSDSSYGLMARLTDALITCTNERVLRTVCCAESPFFDELHWSLLSLPVESELGKFLLDNRRNPNLRARAAEWIRKALAHRDELHSVRAELTPYEQNMLESVKQLLEAAGIPIRSHEIEIYATLGKNVLGTGSETIRLAKDAFTRGTFDLAMTVFEEHIHVSTGAKDFTRGFQDILLRQIIREFCQRTDISL